MSKRARSDKNNDDDDTAMPEHFVEILFADRTYNISTDVLEKMHLFKGILDPTNQFKDSLCSSRVTRDAETGLIDSIHINLLDEGRFGVMLKKRGMISTLDTLILHPNQKDDNVGGPEGYQYIAVAIAGLIHKLYKSSASKYFYKTGSNNLNDTKTMVITDVRVMADMPHIPMVDITCALDNKTVFVSFTVSTWDCLTANQTVESVDIRARSTSTSWRKIGNKGNVDCNMVISGMLSVSQMILKCEMVPVNKDGDDDDEVIIMDTPKVPFRHWNIGFGTLK